LPFLQVLHERLPRTPSNQLVPRHPITNVGTHCQHTWSSSTPAPTKTPPTADPTRLFPHVAHPPCRPLLAQTPAPPRSAPLPNPLTPTPTAAHTLTLRRIAGPTAAPTPTPTPRQLKAPIPRRNGQPTHRPKTTPQLRPPCLSYRFFTNVYLAHPPTNWCPATQLQMSVPIASTLGLLRLRHRQKPHRRRTQRGSFHMWPTLHAARCWPKHPHPQGRHHYRTP
jgi:hypothetical protein